MKPFAEGIGTVKILAFEAAQSGNLQSSSSGLCREPPLGVRRLITLQYFSSVCRGLQAAESVHNFALSLNEEAMLLAFDDYQGLLKRYARIPDWQKPVSGYDFKAGAAPRFLGGI